MRLCAVGLLVLFFGGVAWSGQSVTGTEVDVRSFGAIPDDGKSDAEAIQAALDNARKMSLRRVRFEGGVYDFSGIPGWEGDEKPEKGTCYMTLKGGADLELVGAVDAMGRPATRWIKSNDLKEKQPKILAVERGTNIAVRNFLIDLEPYYSSAGKVLTVQDDDVEVEVLANHPRIDGQRAFIMGTYDFSSGLAKVTRLTWDFDLPRWRVVGDDAGRRMKITCRALALTCRPGDGVFWFQGNYCGGLLSFSRVEGLLVENVKILGGHGFPLICNHCRNITYRNVKLAPEGNRIVTSCRDGFKIYRPSGAVIMDRVVIDGCLGDDGQNIHGTWLVIAEKRSQRSLIATHPRENIGQHPLTPGSRVKLLDQELKTSWESTVVTCEVIDKTKLLLTFRDQLPDWADQGLPLEPQEWLPEKVHIKNCVYRNTGRFGLFLKGSNALIEDTLFEGNVGAIRIGGMWSWSRKDWQESTNPWNVEVRRCTFRKNRLDMHYGGKKEDTAITIVAGRNIATVGLMRDIRIHDNVFINEGTCLDARNCEDIWFWNNQVTGCDRILVQDRKTARSVSTFAPSK